MLERRKPLMAKRERRVAGDSPVEGRRPAQGGANNTIHKELAK